MDTEKLIERLRDVRCDETSPCLASWAEDAADALEASTRRVKRLEEALATEFAIVESMVLVGATRLKPSLRGKHEIARTTLSQEGL